jgi:hypothetical protein
VSLYFVTPAWKRYELTAVCLEQRQRVMDYLASYGIDARCVVVADDENLDIARSLGFDTVEQNNEWLGRKFNDGIEYAVTHGAEWIVPIGSDSWIDPAYFLPLPAPSYILTSALYAVVEPGRIGYLKVGDRNPAGPHVIHRDRLPITLRPARDDINRHIDSSTLKGLQDVQFESRGLHPLQYIGFRQEPLITPYVRLMKAWGVRESTDPWGELAKYYPANLIERARAVL